MPRWSGQSSSPWQCDGIWQYDLVVLQSPIGRSCGKTLSQTERGKKILWMLPLAFYPFSVQNTSGNWGLASLGPVISSSPPIFLVQTALLCESLLFLSTESSIVFFFFPLSAALGCLFQVLSYLIVLLSPR